MLEAVEKVEIRILADNVTDGLSSNPPFVESEIAFLGRRGVAFSARCLCCAVHGLSCLVTVHRGGKTNTVLFDSGPRIMPSSATSRGLASISVWSRAS